MEKMNILCIIHAGFESPGVIGRWAEERGHTFKVVSPYKGRDDLRHEPFDFLIVMGGPQSPLALEKYPYLKDEIDVIRQAVHMKKRILGVCLGAQLIGEALGAKTMISPEKEIGVYPITLTPEGLTDPLFSELNLPSSFPVMHWHNDMPGVTKESVLLAYSEGCPRQIIRYAPMVYGFQCHLEITLEGIKTMVEAVPEDLKPSQFVQTSQTVLNQDYGSMNQVMLRILDRLVVLEVSAYESVAF